MRLRSAIFAALLGIAAFGGVGCGSFLGGFRKDVDDSAAYEPPVVGGRWSERGLLSEDGTDRMPAGDDSAQPRGRAESWVNQEQLSANRRDRFRGTNVEEADLPAHTYSNTPNLAPAVKRMYKNGARATRQDFVDESQDEGSLWSSGGQTNYFFTKNKIRGVGDLVTINIEADLIRDIGLEMRRSLTPSEKEAELKLAQTKLIAKAAGAQTDKLASSAAAPAKPAADAAKKDDGSADVPEATPNDVDVSQSLDVKAGDLMMGEVLDRYPNGNYKIRAVKKIPYRNGLPRLVTLIGIAKGTDIGEDDVIASGKLYEYRIEAIR